MKSVVSSEIADRGKGPGLAGSFRALSLRSRRPGGAAEAGSVLVPTGPGPVARSLERAWWQ